MPTPFTYTRVNWADSPSTSTPVSASDLNTMDSALATVASQCVQEGSGNLAALPLQIIIVGPDSSHLPAAGTKGRIAFVVPFSLP
jgi:hypothetical protein